MLCVVYAKEKIVFVFVVYAKKKIMNVWGVGVKEGGNGAYVNGYDAGRVNSKDGDECMRVFTFICK